MSLDLHKLATETAATLHHGLSNHSEEDYIAPVLAALERVRAESRPDTERLDWLEAHPGNFHYDTYFGKWTACREYWRDFLTAREAIDFAMSEPVLDVRHAQGSAANDS